jgi:hypothetical protein
MSKERNPEIYLDCDGVILSREPFENEIQKVGIDNWSEHIVRRLADVAAHKTWLTTWGESEITQLEKNFGLAETLANYRLSRSSGCRGFGSSHLLDWKLELIDRDQKDNLRPFVWIDDNIDDEMRAKVESKFDAKQPHLLLSPETRFGLQPEHLDAVEEFVKNHQQNTLAN